MEEKVKVIVDVIRDRDESLHVQCRVDPQETDTVRLGNYICSFETEVDRKLIDQNPLDRNPVAAKLEIFEEITKCFAVALEGMREGQVEAVQASLPTLTVRRHAPPR